MPQPVERRTFVLFSSVALIALFTLWQPIGGIIWDVQDSVGRIILYGLFFFGIGLVLLSTFLINHFDLFGLRQVWLYLRGKAYTHLRFVTPGPYKYIRHPLYVGWFFAFWATPTMTAAHLVFAIATTAYILIAIQFEERDLVRFHSEYAYSGGPSPAGERHTISGSPLTHRNVPQVVRLDHDDDDCNATVVGRVWLGTHERRFNYEYCYSQTLF